jgi:hypothetical protein
MDFNYRPTSRLMSPADIQAERQAALLNQQKNALFQMEFEDAQNERVQRRNALMQQQQQQGVQRNMLNDMAGNMGPPQDFQPAALMMAGFDPKQIEMLRGPQQKPREPIQRDPTKELITWGPDGKPTVALPAQAEAPKMPTSWQEFELAMKNPEFAAYTERMKRAGAAGGVTLMAPIPVQQADGTVTYVQPGNRPGAQAQPVVGADGKPLVRPGESEKPLTEGQAKAVLFSSRMQAADRIMSELARKGASTTFPGATRNNAVGDVITAMSPPEQQQLVQAKRDFVNAVLRRESGAVISPEEFANAERQYFPQIGDSRPVIEQKARNRRAAIEGMRADVPKSRQGEVDRISGGGQAEQPAAPAAKQVVRTGTLNGRKVVQYSDGSTAYAD